MLVAFFESIKYVGHMVPIAFLRIYMGYFYLGRAIERYQGDDLVQPKLAAQLTEILPASPAPAWYKHIAETIVIPHWQVFAYLMTYVEFLIGISFLVGFFVRPSSILGVFLMLNFIYISGADLSLLYKTHLALFVVMLWLGAGRCLGFDYFFFKRKRGLWW